MAGNAQTVIDLDKKRMQAMAKKDVATLQSVLADDLIYTHSSASTNCRVATSFLAIACMRFLSRSMTVSALPAMARPP